MLQLQTLLMMDATSSVLPVDVLKNSPTWARHGVGPRVRELNCATRPLNAFLHMTDREFGVHAQVQGSCCAARRQNTNINKGTWASRSEQSVHALLAYLGLGITRSALKTLDPIGFLATLTVTDCAIMVQCMGRVMPAGGKGECRQAMATAARQ